MKTNILAIIIGIACLCLAPVARAALSVQVDRDQLSLDETLTLTITKDGSGALDAALLKPLNDDFQVLSQSQSSSTQFVNGSMSSSFTLTLDLAPKRAGLLTIPALTIGKESSQPRTVRVLTQAQPKTRADNAPIFLESEVDAHAVWVQEQVIYTLRIYAAVEASIDNLELPPLRDALMEKLDDAKYTKVIAGRTYQVFERKYAIFPQKSGGLEIPAALVQATVAGPRRPDRFSGFFGTPGELVRLHGNPEKITVREKPPEYPAGAVWLPTAKLTVAADWSRDLKELRVGEPLTLTIGLAGEGLLAAQLPKVTLPEIAGVKLYQDQGEVQNLTKGSSITGVRKESIALVTIRPGGVELPEIRIPWWDKNQRKVAYAIIPARRLEIKDNPAGPAGSWAPPVPTGANPEPPGTPTPPAPATTTVTPSRLPLLLGAACGLLALGWLVTLGLLLKTRREMAGLNAGRRADDTTADLKEREAFTALAKACRDHNPRLARPALLAWVKIRQPVATARNVAELERLFPGAGLAVELADLDRILYGKNPDQVPWQGERLLTAATEVRKGAGGGSGTESPLPPLYR
jgi:hypothetical protein